MSDPLVGRRLPDDSDWREAQPGDYWRVRWTGSENEWWFIDPRGKAGGITKHAVTEHDDGTITVSPSIAPRPGDDGWHGWLRAGVWEEMESLAHVSYSGTGLGGAWRPDLRPEDIGGIRALLGTALTTIDSLEARLRDTETALRELEAEERRYHQHAEDTGDEGGHVGEERYYRLRAQVLGYVIHKIRSAVAPPAESVKDLGRDASAAGVDGAGHVPGHHEPVGERQGRQPAQGLPERVVVGENGAYWRDFGDFYSMCPVSTDNDPVRVVAVYALAPPDPPEPS